MAGAGFGTSGATTTFGIKENNYLGKGISLNANATINESSVKGKFTFRNPNYNNTNRAIYGSLQSQETINYQILVTKPIKLEFRLAQVLNYMMI